jgi:hypothetical protein
VYHEGVLIAIDLGEDGPKLLARIWSLRVQNALSADVIDADGLSTLQEEAVTLRIGEENELCNLLNEAVKRANPITCFCEQLLKGTPTITCTQCGTAYHGICLGMSPKDMAQSSARYVCGPCKRQRCITCPAVMPSGWEDFVDPSGRPIYIHRDSKKTSWDLPPGALPARVVTGQLEYVPNPCFDRVGQEHSNICMVCFQPDEENDVSLKCRECGIRVHPTCYGVKAEQGNAFTCRSCEFAVRAPTCPMCPLVGGAVKPLTVGGWAHMVCAIYMPELQFVHPDIMEPIDGALAVSKDRKKIKCSVCKTAKGAVVQCDEPGCRVSWHPLCGIESGLYMVMSENEAGELVTVVKCQKHGPHDDEDEEDNKLYCLCRQR